MKFSDIPGMLAKFKGKLPDSSDMVRSVLEKTKNVRLPSRVNAGIARVAGHMLRATDRATGNGLLLRSEGSRTGRKMSDLLTGMGADMLKAKGTPGILKSMDKGTSGKALNTMLKSVAFDPRLIYGTDIPDALKTIRTQVKLPQQVDTSKMSPADVHKVIAGYSRTLDNATHGTFGKPITGASNEVMRSVKGDPGHLPEQELFKFKLGDSDFYATGKNVNGMLYLEEGAGKDLREELKFLEAAGASNTPITTTVMADIGDMMARRTATNRRMSVKAGNGIPPGWHVVATTDGLWGDPFRRTIRTPKLVLVNDAALKGGFAESAIAQHTGQYGPSFVDRNKFYDKNTIEGMNRYSRAAKAIKADYEKIAPRGPELQQARLAREQAANTYYQMVDTGKLPDGGTATATDYEQALGRLKDADAALDGELRHAAVFMENTPSTMSREINQSIAMRQRAAERGRARRAKQDQKLMDMLFNGGKPQAQEYTPPTAADQYFGIRNMQMFNAIPYPYKPGKDGDLYMDEMAKNVSPQLRSVLLNKNAAVHGANYTALLKTLRNAGNMFRHHPVKAMAYSAERLGWHLPVQTALSLRHPKEFISNTALYNRLAGEYHTHDQIANLIRQIRTNQIAGLSGIAMGGTYLGAKALGNKPAPTIMDRAMTTLPAPVATAAEKVTEPVQKAVSAVAEPVQQAASAVTNAVQPSNLQNSYAKALEWASNHKGELALGTAATAAVLGGLYAARRRRKRHVNPYGNMA